MRLTAGTLVFALFLLVERWVAPWLDARYQLPRLARLRRRWGGAGGGEAVRLAVSYCRSRPSLAWSYSPSVSVPSIAVVFVGALVL